MNVEMRSAGIGVAAPAGAGKKAWVEKFQALNNGNPRVCQDVFEWLWRYSDRFIPRNAKWFIWKIERQKAVWNNAAYHEASIAQAAAEHGAMLYSIHGFEEEPLPTDDPKNLDIVRYGHWHLDFDSEKNVELALQDLRKMLFELLPSYGVDPNVVPVYYSGSKGFHATVFNTLLRTDNGDKSLPLIYSEMALEFKKKIPTLDAGIYKLGKGQLYRIPNIKRTKSGLHKIPLLPSEIADGGLSMSDIMELAKQPRLIALPAIPKSEVMQ